MGKYECVSLNLKKTFLRVRIKRFLTLHLRQTFKENRKGKILGISQLGISNFILCGFNNFEKTIPTAIVNFHVGISMIMV